MPLAFALAGRSMERLRRTQAEITEDGGHVLGVYSAELRSEPAVLNNNLASYLLMSRELFTLRFDARGGNVVHIRAEYVAGTSGLGLPGAKGNRAGRCSCADARHMQLPRARAAGLEVRLFGCELVCTQGRGGQ